MEFEWDDAKAESNFEKHGVDFVDAVQVFDDLTRTEWIDTREAYGEERYYTVGMVEGRVLFVAYTMREERVRLINARPATRTERNEYHGNR